MSNKSGKRAGAKLTFVVLSVFIFLLLFAPIASAATYGDINNDGKINVQDVVLVMKHVLELETLTDAQKAVADVNGDGVINVQDVTLIMQYSLGLINSFPDVALKVMSVTAVNARQVEVVFNKAVTASLAQNPANYEVYKQGALFTNVFGTATNGAVASLQADGKTVRLTLNDQPTEQVLVNGSNFNRVVVKAAVGLAADYTDSAVEFLDTTAPTFVSVRSIGANLLELTFSEPVTATLNVAGLSLTDGIVPVALNHGTEKFHDPTRTMTIETVNALTPGATYTFSIQTGATVNHLGDYVGFKIVPSSRQFTHVPVVDAPTVTASAINEKTVRLAFNRPVSLTAVGDNVKFRLNFNLPAAIHRTSADMDGFGQSFALAEVDGSGGKMYDVQFASPMTAGSNTLFINYADINLGKIADGWGNVLPNNTSVTFTVSASTTPVIVNARTVTARSIAITYSRTVTNNGLEPEQYEYNGVPGLEIVSDTGNEVVVRFYNVDTFTTAVAIPAGEIEYIQSNISSRRTKDQSSSNDVLSPDKIVGIASGF